MSKLQLHLKHLPTLKQIAYACRDKANNDNEDTNAWLLNNHNQDKSDRAKIKKTEALTLTAKAFEFKDWGTLQAELKHSNKQASPLYGNSFIPESKSSHYRNRLKENFNIKDPLFTFSITREFIFEDETAKQQKVKLEAMADNPNAKPILADMYHTAAEEGKHLDLIIIGLCEGYGIKLKSDENAFEKGIVILTPVILEPEHLNDSRDLMAKIIEQSPNPELFEKNTLLQEEHTEPQFGGVKVRSEMENPYFYGAPELILNHIPTHNDTLAHEWRRTAKSIQRSAEKNKLYYLPTPIIDEIDENIVSFVDVAEDTLHPLNNMGYSYESKPPKDAIELTELQRIYLSMAHREWDDKTILEKFKNKSLERDVLKLRNNQKIIDLLTL